MYYLDNPWSVRTMSGRRPTPTAFEHLRGYPPLEKIYSRIRNITDLTEIQEILNQEANLYLSNEISQVISQMIALHGTDFVTLHCTEDGALHVSIQEGLAPLLTGIVLAAGANLIGNVKIAGTTRTLQKAEIDFAGSGDTTIITATALVKIHVTSLVLTVGGQTNLTLKTGSTDISGPMDFGGTNEPRGMTANHGEFALQCGTNEAFVINSSAAVQVSGYVIYFKE